MEYYLTKQELKDQQSDLIAEKMKLDKFFSMYLDKFGLKMDSKKPNTKVWALYNKKLEEYTEVTRQIKTLEYRISKF